MLTAAGRGERLGLDRPKAFARLGDRPLVAESLQRLELSGWIDRIVVVAPPGWEEPVILLAEELGVGKVVAAVPGARHRAESVRNGVAEVAPEAVIILVHDAARPLVADAVVERVLQPLAEGWDGAVPVLPVADTVKRIRDGQVIETVDRTDLVVVQTPQAFLAERLREALAGDISAATDCSSLVEARGGRVRAVPGDRRLVKVTERPDLELVESLLSPA
ncbi:MAG: 2-C-methyl-D-erythritol 4-phosphate cytidylyltransferase [Actinomycetota bacterium]|nr:2-C-methyl-D-erythritol 4-phosphate cytidylyltransferase [Actinomycetota bacterium]